MFTVKIGAVTFEVVSPAIEDALARQDVMSEDVAIIQTQLQLLIDASTPEPRIVFAIGPIMEQE